MNRLSSVLLVVALATGCAGTRARPDTAVEPTQPVPVTHPIARPAPRPAPTDAEIKNALIARRRDHLAVLRSYREARQFPRNTTQPGDGHFLIDQRGVLCAVANLIAMDGHRGLIEEASRSNNGLLFGDVVDGPFHAWILTSGFTQEEIARIQVPAPFVGEDPRPLRPSPVPMPEPDPIPEPGPSPIELADQQVYDYLVAIEAALTADESPGVALAAERLTAHPELVAALLEQDAPAADAVAANVRFAQPPP